MKKLQLFEVKIEGGKEVGRMEVGKPKNVADSIAEFLEANNESKMQEAISQTKKGGVRRIEFWADKSEVKKKGRPGRKPKDKTPVEN